MRLIGLVVLALEFTLAPLAAQAQPPSDAEMIAHFKAHREEFEALVALYEAHGHILSSHPEYQKHAALLKRAGIHHLSANSDIWLPEPYSTETAEKARGMNPFHSYAHHDLVFSAAKLIPSSRVQALVWKDYFYVPVVPRVEQSRLWWPRSPYSGRLNRSARVFDSLDEYPADWVQGRSALPRGSLCAIGRAVALYSPRRFVITTSRASPS